jgi:DNA-binding CsgD family transcriptional regulator/PAS domain-containing protein
MRWGAAERSYISVIVRADPVAVRDYERYYCTLNPWMLEGAHKFTPGVVLPDEALVERNRIQRTEFYNDFLTPFDMSYALGACVMGEPPLYSNVTILRPAREGPFEAREIEMVSALVPHIRRAVSLQRRLSGARTLATAATIALEGTTAAVILVDHSGRVVFANERAQRLMARRDTLRLFNGELHASTPSDTRALRTSIRRAAETTAGRGFSAGATLRIPCNATGTAHCLVTVSPLPSGIGVRRAAAMVTITQPLRPTNGATQAWHTLFGLTGAEIAVASLAATGADPADIATSLSLTVSTVRTHIKHIHRKTGTRRYGEMVSALRRTLPLIDDHAC